MVDEVLCERLTMRHLITIEKMNKYTSFSLPNFFFSLFGHFRFRVLTYAGRLFVVQFATPRRVRMSNSSYQYGCWCGLCKRPIIEPTVAP